MATTPGPGPPPIDDREFRWLVPIPHPLRHPLLATAWIARLLLGLSVLITLLTVAGTVPPLNLVVLGYLLELQGQVARSGKLRHSLPLLPAAIRIGVIAVGLFLWLCPLAFLARWVADAQLIQPHGIVARSGIVLLGLASAVTGIHLLAACARGGKLTFFLRPIQDLQWLFAQLRSGDYWTTAGNGLQTFLGAVRPGHLVWLGTRGFLSTWLWLVIPSALHGAAWYSSSTASRIATLVGGLLLIPVLAWTPWLQVRLATENRWSAMFDLRGIRERFRHAPLCWSLATAFLYFVAIPLFLYSLKYRMNVPLRATVWWDLTLLSLVCTIPARIAVSWSYHRASTRGPAWWGWVWLGRLLVIISLAAYIWLLFQTPLTHESHPWQLEHHTLVLPIPFPNN